MPSFEHGRNTAVFLDGVNLSPYLTATDFSIDLDTADTTTYGSTWKSSIAGTIGAKVDFGGLYDPAQTAFESLAGDIVSNTVKTVEHCLNDAGLRPQDVHQVILVGGQTRTPLVQSADRKSTRLNSSHMSESRMPSSA